MKRNLTLRVDSDTRAKLEARRRVGGFSSLSATVASFVNDPGVILFGLFREGKGLADIVLETKIPPDVVRACYIQYRDGFESPVPIPVPIVVEKLRVRRAELRLEAMRDGDQSRREIERDKLEARKVRDANGHPPAFRGGKGRVAVVATFSRGQCAEERGPARRIGLARYVPTGLLKVGARLFAIISARQSVLHRTSDRAFDSAKWPRKMGTEKSSRFVCSFGRASSDSRLVITPLIGSRASGEVGPAVIRDIRRCRTHGEAKVDASEILRSLPNRTA